MVPGLSSPAKRGRNRSHPHDRDGSKDDDEIWGEYCKHAKAYDKNLGDDWNDDLDVLLIVVRICDSIVTFRYL